MIPYVLAKGLQSGLISPEDLGVDVPEHSAIP